MDIGDMMNLGGLILVGTGTVVTWMRNGKKQAERDHALMASQASRDQMILDKQNTVIQRLDDGNMGLGAINNRLQSFETNCARVSTGLATRLAAAEQSIDRLKNGD